MKQLKLCMFLICFALGIDSSEGKKCCASRAHVLWVQCVLGDHMFLEKRPYCWKKICIYAKEFQLNLHCFDLASYDFWLFAKIKSDLRGIKLKNNEDYIKTRCAGVTKYDTKEQFLKYYKSCNTQVRCVVFKQKASIFKYSITKIYLKGLIRIL